METTNALQEARLAAMAPLIAASTESYSRAYPYLVKLHMLQELSDAAVLLQEASLAGPLERQRRLRWDERLKVAQSSLVVQVKYHSETSKILYIHGKSQVCKNTDKRKESWTVLVLLRRD